MYNSKIRQIFFEKKEVFCVLIIVSIILGLFFRTFRYEFLIGWDDQWFVTNHYTENGFTLDNIWSILTEYYYGQYAPVNQFYYTFLYSIFKFNAGYYHLASVLLHCINSVIVFFLVKNITQETTGFKGEKGVGVGFFTALMFAIMPVNLEPVAWVAASKVLLYALFYLLAMRSYRLYILSGNEKFFYHTLIFFIVSFGAKEQAVTFPITMLLLDYIYGRKFLYASVLLEKIPIFLLSFIFGLVTIDSQRVDDIQAFYAIYHRIPLFCYTVSEYLTKCILPVNISYLYPFPFQMAGQVPNWMWFQTMSFPILIYCFWRSFNKKWIIFGFGFFFIHIVLVSNLFSLARFAVVADRYVYLASIGVCYLVSCWLVALCNRFKNRKVLVCLWILYIGYLTTYSSIHLSVWSNVSTLKKKLKSTIRNRANYLEFQLRVK